VLVGKVKNAVNKGISFFEDFTTPTTFKIIAAIYPKNKLYKPVKKATKIAKTRETKKNWPRIDQKAKKEFSKIREYILSGKLF
jgi:hypothetical protein